MLLHKTKEYYYLKLSALTLSFFEKNDSFQIKPPSVKVHILIDSKFTPPNHELILSLLAFKNHKYYLNITNEDLFKWLKILPRDKTSIIFDGRDIDAHFIYHNSEFKLEEYSLINREFSTPYTQKFLSVDFSDIKKAIIQSKNVEELYFKFQQKYDWSELENCEGVEFINLNPLLTTEYVKLKYFGISEIQLKEIKNKILKRDYNFTGRLYIDLILFNIIYPLTKRNIKKVRFIENNPLEQSLFNHRYVTFFSLLVGNLGILRNNIHFQFKELPLEQFFKFYEMTMET